MLISLNIGKNFFYFLFFIFIFIIGFYFEINGNYNDDINFLTQFFTSLFLFIIYRIETILSKREIKIKTIQLKTNNKKIPYDKIFIIIIFFIYYFIYIYLFNFIEEYCEVNQYSHIYFVLLIDNVFFKNQYYSHQILSLNIYLVITIFIFLETFKQFKLSIFFIILSYFSSSFAYLMLKYINIKYFINVYLLGSLIAMLDMINIICFKKISLNLNFSYDDLIYLIGMIILSYLFIYILNKSSTVHSIVIKSNSYIFFLVMNDIRNNKISILRIILIILSIISCLIYLEVIELNFCNLNIDLKKQINEREKIEVENDSKYNSLLENEINGSLIFLQTKN